MISVGAVKKDAYSSAQLEYVSPVSIGGLKALANPYQAGNSFILFTHVPNQIKTVTDSSVETGGDDKFFKLMERSFQEVSGINDISLETEAMSGGFANINHNFPSMSTSATESITLNFQAMEGNLYRAPIQSWLTGIRDPRTGLYSLPKYGGIHVYSVDMLYINTNASVGSKNGATRRMALEFSAIFDSMYPKNVPLSHFNYSKGSHSQQELSIEFNCEMIMGSNIDKISGDVLASKWFYDRYLLPAKKYNPNRKGSGVLHIGENPEDTMTVHDEDDLTYKYFIVDDSADVTTAENDAKISEILE